MEIVYQLNISNRQFVSILAVLGFVFLGMENLIYFSTKSLMKVESTKQYIEYL